MLEKIRKTEFPIPGFKRFRGQLLYGVAGRSIGHCPKGEAFMAEQSPIRACAAGVRRANRLAVKKPAPSGLQWWPDAESNCGHKDFQSSALPTELSGRN